MKPLSKLIKDAKLDYVNKDITEENFPATSDVTDFELLIYEKTMTTKEALADMESKNLRPATMYELVTYANSGWNGTDWVVALGSVWTDRYGYRYVGCLSGYSGVRGLYLYWFDFRWPAFYRFLAVRKSSDSGTLSPSEPLEPLELSQKVSNPTPLNPKETLTIEGRKYELSSYGPPYSDGSRQATLRRINE